MAAAYLMSFIIQAGFIVAVFFLEISVIDAKHRAKIDRCGWNTTCILDVVFVSRSTHARCTMHDAQFADFDILVWQLIAIIKNLSGMTNLK